MSSRRFCVSLRSLFSRIAISGSFSSSSSPLASLSSRKLLPRAWKPRNGWQFRMLRTLSVFECLYVFLELFDLFDDFLLCFVFFSSISMSSFLERGSIFRLCFVTNRLDHVSSGPQLLLCFSFGLALWSLEETVLPRRWFRIKSSRSPVSCNCK